MSVNDLSTELPQLTLKEYVAELVYILGKADPLALARMRLVVGEYQAHIFLDGEAVQVSFRTKDLIIETIGEEVNTDGIGRTDSLTVFALLDGYLEVVDAILDGQLQVIGSVENINRIFMAIEILLDTSPRTPELQALATRFRRERYLHRTAPMPHKQYFAWYPFVPEQSELSLLGRLGLLP